MNRAAHRDAIPEIDPSPQTRDGQGPRVRLVKRAAALAAAAAAALIITVGPWQVILSAASAAPATTADRTKAAARTGPGGPSHRGQLVSVTPLHTLRTKAAVRAELTKDGFSAASAHYGVHRQPAQQPAP